MPMTSIYINIITRKSMNFEICIMTHAIPNSIGIAIATVVMFTVKQSVLVTKGFLQT